VNKPSRDYTFDDKYLDPRVDEAFREMMREFKPDVVHVGHLGHLSTGIVAIARHEFHVPVVVTLHDYWLSCFRGQLVDPDLRLCSGPSDDGCFKCARSAYKRTVNIEDVRKYRANIQRLLHDVDLFLAPSRTMESVFRSQGVPSSKIVYSPYGFDGNRASVVRNEPTSATLQFGFLGRVIPVKGIHLLLNAFRATRGDARLRIHGGLNGQEAYLRAIAGDDQRIEFRGAYDNDDLSAVLSGIDAVVVPSLWIENAPLVIQESKLAGIPVIASDAGGMAELVLHGVDGYVFPLGDEPALTHMLQGLIDEPEKLRSLRVDHGAVREIADDALGCLRHYRSLCAPRRITVVTNPGLCNLN
jgi:glycosyltransferase involved in cell wall biosynthesis